MKTIKVFISQPMNGRPIDNIMKERTSIQEEFCKFAVDSKFMEPEDAICDVNASFYTTDEGKGRLWYLGRSIQAMEEADYIIFSKDWTSAHGCRVEYEAAAQYFNCHAAPTPGEDRYCRCNVYEDGTPVFGKLTPMIDEIFFKRIY
jgi:hypothetical protein